MPENYYHTLLGVEEEILQPDYYQLLLIDLDNDQLTPELVEQKYKVQMGKAQQVRTPKYKDLIEFLKGELRAAKRTLEKPELLKKYNQERGKEVAEKVRDLIDTFIQISGDLSEIELQEIHHQAHILNCPKKMTEALIDEQLRLFGGKRVKASAEQMSRASEIMQKRAAHGRLRSSDRLDVLSASPAASSSESGEAPDVEDNTQIRRMAEVADKLSRSAKKRQRMGPFLLALKVVNVLLVVASWLVIVVLLAALIAPGAVEDPIRQALGEGGVHLLVGANREAEQLQATLDSRTAELSGKLEAADAEAQRLTGEMAAANSHAKELLRLLGGNGNAVSSLSADQLESAHAQAAQMVAHLQPVGEDQHPVARLRELLANHEPQAALELAGQLAGESAADNEVTRFARDHVMPALLADRSPWEWNLAQRPVDFRHQWFRPVTGGLQVQVPGDASEELRFPFGGEVEAGVLELRGRWVGAPGSFGVDFWSDGNDAARGSVTVDPSGAGLSVVVAGETRSAALESATTDGDFTLRVSIAKQPGVDISDLTGKAKAEYVEPSFARPVSSTQSATTAGTRAATGRLVLRFSPGTEIVLETITVR